MNDQAEAVLKMIADARAMVAELNRKAEELRAALINFEAQRQWDIDLRQREAAVLAREDRCTIREREIEKQE